MGNPRPFAPGLTTFHPSPQDRAAARPSPEPIASHVRLFLLEPSGSPSATRIEAAANEAGISVGFIESVESAPPKAALIGVGPSIADPLQVARQLRASGSQALLVFFTGSTSARGALQAELVRDPFLVRRFEIVQLPNNPRQLATRMNKVVSSVRQQHAARSGRRTRNRSRGVVALTRATGGVEHVLAHVLTQSRDAIIITDDGGNVSAWNDAARRLFGILADRVTGRDIESIGAADQDGDSPRLGAIVRSVISSGEPQQVQLVSTTALGERRHIAASVAPVRDRQGVINGASIVALDDTEYQRVQEALREANRQKDEFLAIMSHELRTPLTSILGYTDMLLRGLSGPLPPTTNKYIGNVRAAGDRLLELVNGLLDYTRLEAGVERLDLRPVDPVRLVNEVVQHCQTIARKKNIDMSVSYGRDLPRVNADEQRIVHVLRNFVGNALKFTPAGGWVRVEIGPDPEMRESVRVAVSDSGIGMREEQIGRVWDRFYQGDASLTRPYGGMGLGLSIARHLVALHGGRVGAESAGPQRGSRFWFSLPAAG